jgi:dUTP pyrophosphatase
MELNIFIDDKTQDQDLIDYYKTATEKHNQKVLSGNIYLDAGFDLANPEESEKYTSPSKMITIDYQIKCSANIVIPSSLNSPTNLNSPTKYPTGFYLYPRSSISNTSLRLANSVGIIDSGYRGNLMAKFDSFGIEGGQTLKKFDRLVQICAPSLMPIIVNLVPTKEDLSPETERGEKGFGSSG